MSVFGHLVFAHPWLLGFSAALPVLWWLLRLTPPSPKKIPFPPLALLRNLVACEETPARSPWWLLLLRIVIAALLILAFAGPSIDPQQASGKSGALLIAVDNDWAAARDWTERQNMVRDIVEKAGGDGRMVFLLPTTTDGKNNPLDIAGPMEAPAAEDAIGHLTPQPWPADWRQAAAVLRQRKTEASETVWIAGGTGGIDARLFHDALQAIAATTVYSTRTPILTLAPPARNDDEARLTLRRADTDNQADVPINAVAANGAAMARWVAHFSAGAPEVSVAIDAPADVRNRIARFETEAPRTAASTALLDAAWRHHAVGIAGDTAELDRHSLLSGIYYIDRALKPFADIHVDTLENLLKDGVPEIILTDNDDVNQAVRPALDEWLHKGGVLVRFAGERFAASDHDMKAEFLPVPLRGGRSFGGALSWATPQKLKDFPDNSPFHGLTIPGDVTVNRQILAEPSPDLESKIWAELQDGTPLVTAATAGRGITILFHVPAQSGWSNLPLSGLFVEMLQKITNLAEGDPAAATAQHATLAPLSLLDAFGDAHDPDGAATPFVEGDAANAIGPLHPPGLYGSEANHVALNLGSFVGQPEALRDVPVKLYDAERHGIDVQSWLLLAAFMLLLFDFLLSLKLRGLLRLAGFALLVVLPVTAHAASDERLAIELTSRPTLAYIASGDTSIDRVSELGLKSLAVVLQNRTSLDEVGVARIDPNTDDLAFFPVIYWPVTASEHPLTEEGARRVTHYLRHGGIILFDDANGEGAGPSFLHRVLPNVDIPPLVKLPEKHVLKRSFYLLNDFPGRFADRDVWLEPEEAASYDGVSSVIFGSNGWAAAWAADDAGHPLYPCTPGGEQQREYAYRFGVNLVIYALTGTYKADQQNVSKLLQKMGQE